MSGQGVDWRQGDLLSDEQVAALGLKGNASAQQKAVIITHDCDLLNSSETQIEVIVGAQIDACNPMYLAARHPRTLHLRYVAEGGEQVRIQLSHSNRIAVEREKFLGVVGPAGGVRLKDDEKRILKQWLAARYGRPAFPNVFENRLRKKVGKKDVVSKIAQILEGGASHILGVFFDLDECRGVELEAGDPYPLSIILVYDSLEGGQDARRIAEAIAQEIKNLFEEAYGPPQNATEIMLDRCQAVADSAFTLVDIRKFDQWRVEYISLRQEPPSEALTLGKI